MNPAVNLAVMSPRAECFARRIKRAEAVLAQRLAEVETALEQRDTLRVAVQAATVDRSTAFVLSNWHVTLKLRARLAADDARRKRQAAQANASFAYLVREPFVVLVTRSCFIFTAFCCQVEHGEACDYELEAIPEGQVLRSVEKLELRSEYLQAEAARLESAHHGSETQLAVASTVLVSVQHRMDTVTSKLEAARQVVEATTKDLSVARDEMRTRADVAARRPVTLRSNRLGAVALPLQDFKDAEAPPIEKHESLFFRPRGKSTFLAKQRQGSSRSATDATVYTLYRGVKK
jgi:hypothetical protein